MGSSRTRCLKVISRLTGELVFRLQRLQRPREEARCIQQWLTDPTVSASDMWAAVRGWDWDLVDRTEGSNLFKMLQVPKWKRSDLRRKFWRLAQDEAGAKRCSKFWN